LNTLKFRKKLTINATPPNREVTMGIKLIKIGIVYLLIGMLLGVYMGASKDFTLRPVHAHINLLGWTLLGISGILFHIFPHLEQGTLAKVYFWLYNLSVPVTMIGLAMFLRGSTSADPIIGIGSVLITVSAACFAWLLLTRLPAKE
jgi:cbb3-type cytochrome oxidase subunit 1